MLNRIHIDSQNDCSISPFANPNTQTTKKVSLTSGLIKGHQTSTPEIAAAKVDDEDEADAKRKLSPQSKLRKAMAERKARAAVLSSDEETEEGLNTAKKRRPLQPSPRKQQQKEAEAGLASPEKQPQESIDRSDSFKIPTNVSQPDDNLERFAFISGSDGRGLNQEEMKKLNEILPKEFGISTYTVRKERSMPFYRNANEALNQLEKGNSLDSLLAKRGRVSDVSSLSSNSAGSSGYLADTGSSIGSGSSVSSMPRDRLSIMPEADVTTHNVISPLPKKALPKSGYFHRMKALAENNENQDEEKDDELELEKENAKKDEADQKKKEKKSRRKSGTEKPPVVEKVGRYLPLKKGQPVFAKFQERTIVRYWPAKVLNVVEGQEEEEIDDSELLFEVKFIEDGIVTTLKAEELIPCSALVVSLNLTVQLNDDFGEHSGTVKKAKVMTFPDVSQPESVFYQVTFIDENNEVITAEEQTAGDLGEKLISYKDCFLNADQARAAKVELGGLWRPKVVPNRTSSDLSLDNLMTSKRRTKSTTSSPSRTPTKRSTAVVKERKSSESEKKESSSKKTTSARKRGGRYVETSLAEETELDDSNAGRKSSSSRKRANSSEDKNIG